MRRKHVGRRVLVAIALGAGILAGGLLLSRFVQAQMQHGGEEPTGSQGTGGVPHATPEGWRFTFSADGKPGAGRDVFVRMECYSCHEVRGEKFPPRGTGGVGPELSQMAAKHPPEYFAEAIVNPNAVIGEGPGYRGSDGRSIMPDYSESMTLRELIDLVAYLKSLKGGGGGH